MDPKAFILRNGEYKDLFMPVNVGLVSLAGAALGAYRSRSIMRIRPISSIFNVFRGATIGYVFGFCMLTDSVAFHQHLYSLCYCVDEVYDGKEVEEKLVT